MNPTTWENKEYSAVYCELLFSFCLRALSDRSHTRSNATSQACSIILDFEDVLICAHTALVRCLAFELSEAFPVW